MTPVDATSLLVGYLLGNLEQFAKIVGLDPLRLMNVDGVGIVDVETANHLLIHVSIDIRPSADPAPEPRNAAPPDDASNAC